MKMKKVLIPTDFSKNAWNATRYALELFENEKCEINLLNTYTPAIATSRFLGASIESGNSENSAKFASTLGLKNLVKHIAKDFNNSNHTIKTISSFSFLIDEIKEILDVQEIDFIVMGTAGATGLKEVFMGTHTVKVIKSIRNCPVLVVPNDFIFSKTSEIAFATDYKRSYDAEMLNSLRQMALCFDATIRIMHITEEKTLNKFQDANMHILSEYLSAIKHTLHWAPLFASKSEVIGEFVEEMSIDILAMVNFEHSPLSQLMREPVIKHLAFHMRVPLLVLPEFGRNELSNLTNKHRNILDTQT